MKAVNSKREHLSHFTNCIDVFFVFSFRGEPVTSELFCILRRLSKKITVLYLAVSYLLLQISFFFDCANCGLCTKSACSNCKVTSKICCMFIQLSCDPTPDIIYHGYPSGICFNGSIVVIIVYTHGHLLHICDHTIYIISVIVFIKYIVYSLYNLFTGLCIRHFCFLHSDLLFCSGLSDLFHK